ncbi:PDR/VanB family oxidoreductase [Leifsonia sp. H3M29-4]|uniref:PDR/VanB family oxidoreductase n=1 Tax=Salinibacterium metalliresistens TaxID=3031321 RepID=UPI0023DA4E06|nr:PDR/VanB family oxidoreductase [Salinibacterium metalliresistens]MDF1479316.1 PDR/VanB family oxidoreductase [Salinibacterium metalliresistens]
MTVIARDDRVRGVTILDLAHPEGVVTPSWEPGAHIDVRLPDGRHRSYSLCGEPGSPVWRIAVRRSGRADGGSAWVHETLTTGATLLARAPRNHFALEPAERYLFIAGGIGITPILPMLQVADAAGADWRLAYVGRGAERMAFRDELSRYGDRVHVFDTRRQGRPDLAALAAWHGDGGLVYLCGTEGLIDAARRRWGREGDTPLRVEAFTPAASGAAAEAFEAELAASGVTVDVPADRSLLQAAEAAGAFVLSSCQEGTCGTCETVVLAGTVDHRDSVLTAAERSRGDRMMICVSRAAPGQRLVLDL